MKKNNGIKGLLAALAITTGLTACHSYANDNTSRPCQNDENGNNIGNDEIEQNRSMGSDTNPRNVMWDGYTSPEESVGGPLVYGCGKHNEGAKDHEGHKNQNDEKSHSGHGSH